MPRKSKASLILAHIGPGMSRLQPPAELAPEVAAIFRETVASAPADHFQPEDSVLLTAYCQTAVLVRQAAAALAANPIVNGRVSPWLAAHTTHVRLLAQLAMRLKLGPRARRPDARRVSKPSSPPSYYDTMDIGPRSSTTAQPQRRLDERWYEKD
jgi:phage terminase small subunit